MTTVETARGAVTETLTQPPASGRAGPGDSPGGTSAPRRRDGWLVRLLIVLLPALVVFGGRAAIAEPFRIPSTSMTPTLVAGDHALANKLAYRLGSPQVGDIVVFEHPRLADDVLVKRIVATGGQTVEIWDGELRVDDRPRREAYVDYARVDGYFFGPVRVPKGSLFVLGDNRDDSKDSREFGAISPDSLIGRVDLRVWPLSRIAVP